MMYPEILKICRQFEKDFSKIDDVRKQQLLKLSKYVNAKSSQKEAIHLIVICTHNSRRSHIGQIWLAVAAAYYKIPNLSSYSGGTEATSFNERAVKAFREIGFEIRASDKTTNPKYEVNWQDSGKGSIAFSKKYDSPPNPTENFGAIMVCTEADKGCPIIFGNDFRLSLPYSDPKAYDDTDLESEKYKERIFQIGLEIFYAICKASK